MRRPRRTAGSSTPSFPRPAPDQPAPIGLVLIADDDETTRLVLQRALTNFGYIAIPVDDGGLLWPILERETVHTLVLDLNMPGVNGWEVLRRLRTDRRYLDPPLRVVVISGQCDVETRDFAVRLGADVFLPKPIDLEALAIALANLRS